MITASNLTTAEAGRNSRKSTKRFEEADIKEAEREEDRVSELESSEEGLTQADVSTELKCSCPWNKVISAVRSYQNHLGRMVSSVSHRSMINNINVTLEA